MRGLRPQSAGEEVHLVANEGIFLIHGDQPVLLERAEFETEDLLQEAIGRYPQVIAGHATSGDGPGRLLLVKREMPVRGADENAASFSLDHLFLDADGVPVLVEVKRSSDTRIRREVVAQMLDYAANASASWSAGMLRASFVATCEQDVPDVNRPDEILADVIGDADVDEYWERVEANLRAGRVRLVFVADAIPEGLTRIIEFLNEHMPAIDVLGVEVPQYVGGGQQALVPRLVGRTAKAVAVKRAVSSGSRLWNESTYFEAATSRRPPEQVEVIRKLHAHLKARGGRFGWGEGATPGVSGNYPLEDGFLTVWVTNAGPEGDGDLGYVEIWRQSIAARLGEEAVARFSAAVGLAPGKRSKLGLRSLAEGRNTENLLASLDALLAAPTIAGESDR